MSQPAVQILTFTPSEAFKNDAKATFKEVNDILLQEPGYQASYHGICVNQTHEPAGGCLIILWDNFASHKALIDAPHYPTVLSAFNKAVDQTATPPSMIHVLFHDHAAAKAAFENGFNGGTTEISICTVNPGNSVEGITSALEKFMVLDASSGLTKGQTWGPTLEKENVVVGVTGWESLEAHGKHRQEMVANPETMALFVDLAEKMTSEVRFMQSK